MNLYIVLDYEKIKFVLDTPKPAILEAGANDITKTEHATLENANTSLRCYILASVVGHLRQQITPLDSGVEMLQTLEGMFAKSTASERQTDIIDLINTRMTGGRVKDHFFGNDFTYQSSRSDEGKTSKGDEDRSLLAITA